MADLTARPDHWTDSLPGNWQQAINTNGILNALGRALSRQAPDMTRGIEHDQYGSVSDRNWLLQQAAGGPPKLNPLAAEMLDKGGLLANFLGPGVKLPAAAPKPRFSGLPDHLAAPLLADDEWTRLLGNVPKDPTRIGNFNLIREPGWDRVHYGLVPEGVTSLWLPDGSSVPRIGRFQAKPGMNGGIEVTNAYIDQPYTGRGLGQQVYDTIAADFSGVPLVPSSWNQLSPHAVKFWSKRDPEVLGRIRDIQRASYEGDRYPERLIQAAAPKPTGIRAYHGSPHDFDRFDINKIGTGEGAQAYGPGLYFAESEGVAKSYRDNLSGGRTRGADNAPVYEIPRNVGERINAEGRPAVERRLAELDQLDKAESQVGVPNSAQASDPGASIRAALGGVNPVPSGMGPSATRMALRALERNALQEMMRTGDFKWSPPGRMYEVRINADPEQFLDWDKPLAQQSEAVKRTIEPALRAAALDLGKGATPEVLARFEGMGLKNIADRMRPKEIDPWSLDTVTLAQQYPNALRDAGIPGVKYLDQMSRGKGEGSRNYAVWDDKLIEILRKYGLLPPVAAGTAAAINQQEPPL